jgi:hypothetical protein
MAATLTVVVAAAVAEIAAMVVALAVAAMARGAATAAVVAAVTVAFRKLILMRTDQRRRQSATILCALLWAVKSNGTGRYGETRRTCSSSRLREGGWCS